MAGVYWALSHHGYLAVLTDEERLRGAVASLSWFGILAVVALIAIAIVMSPVPSGPIAMVAGSVYGPLWGGIYTVIGSVLGASIAFGLARYLGYDVVCRWLKDRFSYLTQKRSQTRLMMIVFFSRLIPFISFDAVSYAAGLTPLAFWRFMVATLAGVIPISFLLTFLGDQLFLRESGWTVAITILIGVITLLPIAINKLKKKLAK